VTSPQEGSRACIFIVFLVLKLTVPLRLAVYRSTDIIGIVDVIATISVVLLVIHFIFLDSPVVCNWIGSRSPCSSPLLWFLLFFLNFTLFFLFRFFFIFLLILIFSFLHFLSS
ncbi:hypothetical protein PFISCL1PPCAC_787, partial [Pristionchus fissidentatus]